MHIQMVHFMKIDFTMEFFVFFFLFAIIICCFAWHKFYRIENDFPSSKNRSFYRSDSILIHCNWISMTSYGMNKLSFDVMVLSDSNWIPIQVTIKAMQLH